MEAPTDTHRQALEIIKKCGAGSAQYAAFIASVGQQNLVLPHGVALPRYVPGDIRSTGKKKSRRGGKEVNPAGGSTASHESLQRRRNIGRRFKSFSSFSEGDKVRGSGQMMRTVSETLLIEGLEPVVITRRPSVEKEELSGLPESVNTAEEGSGVSGAQARTQGVQVMPDLGLQGIDETDETDEQQKQEMREVVDQFKAVLMQKAMVEGTLSEEQNRNKSLTHDYKHLEKQHTEMKTEQEMMNEQVANQLQHLLKEKSQLTEQNHQLQAENKNLKVLLDLAMVESESDDDCWDKAHLEMEHAAAYSLHEISAWHPAKSPRASCPGDMLCFPDENNVNADSVDGLSGKLDTIAISS